MAVKVLRIVAADASRDAALATRRQEVYGIHSVYSFPPELLTLDALEPAVKAYNPHVVEVEGLLWDTSVRPKLIWVLLLFYCADRNIKVIEWRGTTAVVLNNDISLNWRPQEIQSL